MAVHERAFDAGEVFNESYWGDIDLASQPAEPPVLRFEKPYITDGLTVNHAKDELEELVSRGRAPDYILPGGEMISEYIGQPVFKNKFVRFNRERLVVAGAKDVRIANAAAEAWKVSQPDFIAITRKGSPSSFDDLAAGDYWAYRYESQEGIGIVLPSGKGGQAIFGIKSETVRKPEKWRISGFFGYSSVYKEDPELDIKYSFVPLHLPAQYPARLGCSSKNIRAINTKSIPGTVAITIERTNFMEFFIR